MATAAASRNAKKVMSTLLELITFYNTGKGLYLGKCVEICYINEPKNTKFITKRTTFGKR